jgi:hypothetical protein
MGDIFPWLGRCWCHKHRSREERLERDLSDLSHINVQEGLEEEEKEEIKEGLADSEMERSPNLRNAVILID